MSAFLTAPVPGQIITHNLCRTYLAILPNAFSAYSRREESLVFKTLVSGFKKRGQSPFILNTTTIEIYQYNALGQRISKTISLPTTSAYLITRKDLRTLKNALRAASRGETLSASQIRPVECCAISMLKVGNSGYVELVQKNGNYRRWIMCVSDKMQVQFVGR